MKKPSRVKIDPMKPVPKEELDLPSVFVDREAIDKVREAMAATSAKLPDQISNTVLRGIIHLAAMSMNDKVIAHNLQLPLAHVRNALKSESVAREVERLQMEFFNRDSERMFKRLVPAAVDTIVKIMTSKKSKESARMDAAKYITDRALGKAKENIEVKTDLIGQVFDKLNQITKPKGDTIEAQFEEIKTGDDGEVDNLESMFGKKV